MFDYAGCATGRVSASAQHKHLSLADPIKHGMMPVTGHGKQKQRYHFYFQKRRKPKGKQLSAN